jgi:hypothetical protein
MFARDSACQAKSYLFGVDPGRIFLLLVSLQTVRLARRCSRITVDWLTPARPPKHHVDQWLIGDEGNCWVVAGMVASFSERHLPSARSGRHPAGPALFS